MPGLVEAAEMGQVQLKVLEPRIAQHHLPARRIGEGPGIGAGGDGIVGMRLDRHLVLDTPCVERLELPIEGGRPVALLA